MLSIGVLQYGGESVIYTITQSKMNKSVASTYSTVRIETTGKNKYSRKRIKALKVLHPT